MLVGAQNEVLAEVPERLTGLEELQLTLVSRRRAGLDAPASTTTRTGRSARAGRVVTGMVAGRGGAVGATIARRAGGARARPCTQKAIDLTNWLQQYRGALLVLGLCGRRQPAGRSQEGSQFLPALALLDAGARGGSLLLLALQRRRRLRCQPSSAA